MADDQDHSDGSITPELPASPSASRSGRPRTARHRPETARDVALEMETAAAPSAPSATSAPQPRPGKLPSLPSPPAATARGSMTSPVGSMTSPVGSPEHKPHKPSLCLVGSHQDMSSTDGPQGPPSVQELYSMLDPKDPEALTLRGGPPGIAKYLHSTADMGLSSPDAVERNRETYGANKLPEPDFNSLWDLIWEALQDRTLIMLIIAACISLAVGMATEGPASGWKDGVAVLVAVILITMLTALNDYSKEAQFRKLAAESDNRTMTVLRAGQLLSISVFDLVVGDVVMLETGDIIPADGVFLSGSGAMCDESSATGESETIYKGHAAEGRDPFFLSGTLLVAGSAKMMVVAVGESSYYGRIMLALREPQPDTPLQEKLGKLANLIGNAAVAAAGIIFFAQLIKYLAINGSDLDGSDTLNNIIDQLVIAITIVVVAVPEGLPLAVTIALAYSMKSMMSDNCLVRHLDACETAGGCTTICSDKTGTLTQNRMTVVQGEVLGLSFDEKHSSLADTPMPDLGKISTSAMTRLVEGIALNSGAYESSNRDGKVIFIGSRTECAMLQFLKAMGQDYVAIRNRSLKAKTFPFSSLAKRMSTAVYETGADGSMKGLACYTKGASEVVLGMCSQILTADGRAVPLTPAMRQQLQGKIHDMAKNSLRTIALAYCQRPCPPSQQQAEDIADWTEEDSPNMICVGLIGIHDPLRPEVPGAVAQCQRAGVVVRIVTGDNIHTARSIGRACGVLDESQGHLCIEGPDMRQMSEEELAAILPRVRVMARSSPNDKLLLVSALQKAGEVVAVTGDGVNDGPALKKAAVGFSMGLCGTEVAKEASDIVLLDDNFASLVNSIKWGRNVFDSIRKFLSFQMTVNVSAIIFLFVSLMADPDGSADNAPLQPVQLLWVNLIMDSMAALALATEKAHPSLLDKKPYDQNEPLMNTYCVRRLVTMAVLQLATLLTILYAGEPLFETEKEPGSTETTQFSREHYTVIFNVFVWTQLFNQFNCRKIVPVFNVFRNIREHMLFIYVWIFSAIVQVLMTQFGGDFVKTKPLSIRQWGLCIGFSALPLLWNILFNMLPKRWSEGGEGKGNRIMPVNSAVMLDLRKSKASVIAEANAINKTSMVPSEGGRASNAGVAENSDERSQARRRWSYAVWAIAAELDVVGQWRRIRR